MPATVDTDVIYRIAEPSPADEKRLEIATAAAQDLGIDVAFSAEEVDDMWVGTLRSGVGPQPDRLVAALVVGASRAADNQWHALPASARPTYCQGMRETVAELIISFRGDPFFKAFVRYVNSPQWTMDQERMVDALVTAAGGDLADEHYRSPEVGHNPLLPVSRYPILAGFLEDAIRTMSPPRYSVVSLDMVKLVLASDAVAAQYALFETICSPTHQGSAYAAERRLEYQLRWHFVRDILKAYNSPGDESHRSVLRVGLQDILIAYTTGKVAKDLVREQTDADAAKRGFPNGTRGGHLLARLIVSDIVGAFMLSGNVELVATAKRFMNGSTKSLIHPSRSGNGVGCLS
jgi:hypothetical protein